MKSQLKEKVINLRKEGFSYSEILKVIPIAKSTLSIWLRDVGLSKQQKQQLTDKKLAAAKRGGDARRKMREVEQKNIYYLAEEQVDRITKRDLWLIGTALYWAEGSKEKEYRHGTGVKFSNSDPKMIALFLRYVRETLYVPEERIDIEINIHEDSKNSVDEAREHWARATGVPKEKLKKVYFKKNKKKNYRKNVENLYYGLVRVNITASSRLNRQITGWIRGISKHCGIV